LYVETVTFDEALAKLGVSRDATPDQVRRAYLRRLKVTRPEVNRDEFIALRNAYERVRMMLSFERAARDEGDEPTAVDPDPERRPQLDGGVAIAGHEVVSASPSPEPSGTPGPALLSAEVPEIVVQPMSIQELMARPPAEAAERLCKWFDDFEHRPDAVPPVPVILTLILSCVAAGEVTPARSLTDKLSAWLRRSGRETSLSAQGVVMWLAARELVGVATLVPPSVFVPIAEAALAGDLGKARSRLTELRVEKPDLARAALTELKIKAPMLASAVGWYLAPPPKRRRRFGGYGWQWIGMVGLFLIARLITWSARSGPRRSVDPPLAFVPARVQPPSVEQPAVKTDASATERLKHALGLFFQLGASVAETANRCNLTAAGELVRKVNAEVRDGNCPEAEKAMDTLRGMAAVSPAAAWKCVSQDVEDLHRALTTICTEAQKILDPRKPQ
jgi:hypothetical protein